MHTDGSAVNHGDTEMGQARNTAVKNIDLYRPPITS